MNLFVKLTAVVVGVAGIIFLLLGNGVFCLGAGALGALLFMWATIQERHENEERRHQELVQATREGRREP